MAGLPRAGLVEARSPKIRPLRPVPNLGTTQLEYRSCLGQKHVVNQNRRDLILDSGLGQIRPQGCNVLNRDGSIGSSLNSPNGTSQVFNTAGYQSRENYIKKRWLPSYCYAGRYKHSTPTARARHKVHLVLIGAFGSICKSRFMHK